MSASETRRNYVEQLLRAYLRGWTFLTDTQIRALAAEHRALARSLKPAKDCCNHTDKRSNQTSAFSK